MQEKVSTEKNGLGFLCIFLAYLVIGSGFYPCWLVVMFTTWDESWKLQCYELLKPKPKVLWLKCQTSLKS